MSGDSSPHVPPLRVVLIHGNGGASLDGIWFPYVKQTLESCSVSVVARNFPDPIKGRERFWLPFLRDEICPDASTVIIGHSSGALAAMRFAEQGPLLGTVMVAAHFDDCNFELERKSGFFDRPFDWNAIRRNQRFILQFHSDDDPWIPMAHARQLHHHLGSDFFAMQNEGHFGSYDRNKKDFPELTQALFGAIMRVAPQLQIQPRQN